MTTVLLKNIEKTYPGTAAPTVKDLNLEVRSGEMVALLGPSGCGKSTTLNMISGLVRPTSGEVMFDGRSMLDILPEKREVAMVFQKPLLFPHLSILENVGFGLKMRGLEKKEIREKSERMLDRIKLPGLGNRRPGQLSGGQEQRVSLARGLVIEPKVLLLDEPLSALDANLRIEMRELILNIQRQMKVTTLFVTHDQEEAVMLADKIALMLDGRLHQFDTPQGFYERPCSVRIARFFGCPNFFEGEKRGNLVETPLGAYTIHGCDEPEGRVSVTIRPEHIRIVQDHETAGLPARIVNKMFMGTYTRYWLDVGGTLLEMTADSSLRLEAGDSIRVALREKGLWAMPFEAVTA